MAREWHEHAERLIRDRLRHPGGGDGRVSVAGGEGEVDDLRRRFLGKRNRLEFCGVPPGQLMLEDAAPWLNAEGGPIQYTFVLLESAPGDVGDMDFNDLP